MMLDIYIQIHFGTQPMESIFTINSFIFFSNRFYKAEKNNK